MLKCNYISAFLRNRLSIYKTYLQKRPEVKILTPITKAMLTTQENMPIIRSKGVLKNLAKFIEKHLCQSLFYNFSYRTPMMAASILYKLVK